MSAQVIKIDRATGEILSRGYAYPDTQMSESSAELVDKNYRNTDPTVGYVVIDSTRAYSAKTILEKANSEWNVRMGYNKVLEVTE